MNADHHHHFTYTISLNYNNSETQAAQPSLGPFLQMWQLSSETLYGFPKVMQKVSVLTFSVTFLLYHQSPAFVFFTIFLTF